MSKVFGLYANSNFAPVAPAGDDAGSAGLGMLNGGLSGAKAPSPSPTYPREADLSARPFVSVDPNAAYGAKLKVLPGVARTRPSETAAWEVVPVHSGKFATRAARDKTRPEAIVYQHGASHGRSSYVVQYDRDANLLTVYRDTEETRQSVGTVEIEAASKSKRGNAFSFLTGPAAGVDDEMSALEGATAPRAIGGAGAGFTQRFDRSGLMRKTHSCRLPAVGRAGGEQRFTWKRTGAHGAGDSATAKDRSLVLVDAAGQEYAAFVVRNGDGGSNDADGVLKLLRPDVDGDGADQIVVACAALQETLRHYTQ